MKIFSHAPIVRRDFIRIGTLGALGMLIPETIMPLKNAFGAEESSSATIDRKKNYRIVEAESSKGTKPIVIVWLQGGLSHLDTFSPVPEMPSEMRGPFKQISTKIPGLYVSETIPNTANVMHHVALLRNIYHTQGDHNLAANRVFAGVDDQTPTFDPKYKPFIAMLGNYLSSDSVGYMIINPNTYSVTKSTSPDDALVIERHKWMKAYNSPFGDTVDPERINRRAGLRAQLSDGWNLAGEKGKRLDELMDKGRKVLTGDLSKAFDLKGVSEKEKERYGKSEFGDAGIIAKRLIRAGAPIVLIDYGNWDHHENIQERFKYDMPPLDYLLSALVEDLTDEAIVVIASEFGRTPKINHKKGRDHWPQSNSVVICGPNIKPAVYGKLDSQGNVLGERFNGAYLGPTILKAAGYEIKEDRGGALSNECLPCYPIF